MPWTVRIAKEAVKQLRKLPSNRQEQIRSHLKTMEHDPFRGDVKPLKSDVWQGRYRKRVGRYRLIFVPDRQRQIVEIAAILPRSEKTYR